MSPAGASSCVVLGRSSGAGWKRDGARLVRESVGCRDEPGMSDVEFVVGDGWGCSSDEPGTSPRFCCSGCNRALGMSDGGRGYRIASGESAGMGLGATASPKYTTAGEGSQVCRSAALCVPFPGADLPSSDYLKNSRFHVAVRKSGRAEGNMNKYSAPSPPLFFFQGTYGV
uniref:Uncharacterized protein n=1 Tax=Mycena chlorophos TaxID=658473 RepID=A0ABQ0LM57_MYCCL|nr:predicted protein [Mycena chlorophos]